MNQTAHSTSTSRSTLIGRVLIAFTAVLMLLTLYQIFIVAPVEKQMGIVQKLFVGNATRILGLSAALARAEAARAALA